MLRTRSVPRLAPSTVGRPRLERWLASHVALPVRLIVAPAGTGKTTLLLRYLPAAPNDTAYCALENGAGPSEVLAAIASALGSPSFSNVAAALHALRAIRADRLELAIDDADRATREGAQLLRRLVEESPENVSFIFTAASRDGIDAKHWISRGLGVLCDTGRLAFDANETELLAEACGVARTRNDIGRLLEESDGWAIVVSGALRAAAEDGRPLSDAFDYWRGRYGHVFAEFVAAELERAREEDRALIRSIIAGAACDDELRLQRLEREGLFIIHDGERYRPYNPLRYLRSGHARISSSSGFPPMTVRMFGRFDAQIGGREIGWVRRRDQQIVKYLLLKPGASASRVELAAIFWPDTDRHLAAQSVRTACSNIRKAVAAVVGYAAVERYFRADPDVSLDLSNVVVDALRFQTHVADADADYERGDLDEAAAHYRAAEELYAGRLLDGDVPEAWFEADALALEDRFVRTLERLAEAAFEHNDLRNAGQYAYRVQRLRPGYPGISRLLGKLPAAYGGPATVTRFDEARRSRTSA